MKRVKQIESFDARVTIETTYQLTGAQFAVYEELDTNADRDEFLIGLQDQTEEAEDPDIDLNETTELDFKVWNQTLGVWQ